MSYNYTNGDGVTVLLPAEPNGATEPVSNLDNAIRQIKAFLNDPLKGIPYLEASLASVAAGSRNFFSAYSSANQNITVATPTKLLFPVELADPNTVFDATLSRFTAPATGWYRFVMSVRTDWGTSAGLAGLALSLKLRKNGSTDVANSEYDLDTNTGGATYTLVRTVSLTASEYVEAFVEYNVSAGTVTLQITADQNKTVLQGMREI